MCHFICPAMYSCVGFNMQEGSLFKKYHQTQIIQKKLFLKLYNGISMKRVLIQGLILSNFRAFDQYLI